MKNLKITNGGGDSLSKLEELQSIFAKVFNEKDILLSSETRQMDIDGWDSFTHINLMLTIVKHFHIDANFEEVRALDDVEKIIKFIDRKIDVQIKDNISTKCFEEIKIGDQGKFTKKITAEKQRMFRYISEDVNPLHMEKDFAKESGFLDTVVYGMLISSLYSTVAGVYIPGKYCLLHSVETSFMKPAYIGDNLMVEFSVTDKHDVFKQITIKALITNQNGEKISKAIIKAGVLK